MRPWKRRLPATRMGWGMAVRQLAQTGISPARPETWAWRISIMAVELKISGNGDWPMLPTGALDVHGAAPEVMAGVLPVLRGVGGIGAHEVCFVGLDAHFIDPGDGAPEAGELFDFVPVALHAHHLDDDLHFRAALLFAAGEVDEVVPHLFEFGAFAVELEALFGGAIEAEGDVFEVGIEEALGGGFIEERAVGGEEGEDFVLIAEGDAVEDFGIEERLAETD